jgi:DNA mismatch repair protein MutS
VPFHSILFNRPDYLQIVAGRQEPDCFADLHLDQVLESLTAGRAEYDLAPFFYTPLHDLEAVRYRHEVLRDLEQPAVMEVIRTFAGNMRAMREHLVQAEKMHERYQKERWFLDAVDVYCEAVRALTDGLEQLDLTASGLLAFRDYLGEYAGSQRFSSLTTETRALLEALAGIQYTVHIKGARVTVNRYEGEPDYGAEVESTFAKFKQGSVKDYRVKLPNWPEMDHVEAWVLALVARLFPEVFQTLDDYCARHRDFLDGTVGTFDREVQFYVAYLEYVERFKRAGLPFCYPVLSDRSKEIGARDTFDLALANMLVPDGKSVVCNDFALHGPERVIVVTGPNQGGKTTFARMFGQLPYLASLGCLVPGSEARLFLPDRIFTHFEREEDVTSLRGKLEDELVRIHDILRQATGNSILIMNESFASTTLNDALLLGSAVMKQLVARDLIGVYVTFVDELASLGESTVSMASTIVPDNPAERTYKIVRKPADGLAYAWAIAEKYGLTYEALRRRIAA